MRGTAANASRRRGGTPPAPPPVSQYPFLGTALYKTIPSSATVHPQSQYILANCNWRPTNTAYTWMGPRGRAALYMGSATGLSTASIYVNWPTNCATTPKYTGVPRPANWANILNDLRVGIPGQGHEADEIDCFIDMGTGDYYEGWRVTGPGYPNLAASGGPPAGSCDPNRWNAVIYLKYAGAAINPAVTGGNSVSPTSGASASSILLGAGMLYPQDFADLSLTSVIPHALRLGSACASNGTNYPKAVLPARTGDGVNAIGIPMGARIRLKPSIDVNSWASISAKAEPWRGALRKICRTLQQYGAVLCDTDGAVGAGNIDCCFSEGVHSWPGYSNYVFPWEASTSNVGWSYGNGGPYDLMNPVNWDIMDWGVWTGY